MQLNEYMIHMCIRLSSRVEFLRTAGFDNICVSRSRLQDYSLWETGCKTVFDNRKHPRVTGRSRSMEISFATPDGKEDKDYSGLYLFVKSGIIACQPLHAIRCTMKQEGISHSWKRIRDIMSSQTMVTARMKLEHKDSLILHDATRLNQEHAKLYSVLKLKQTNPNMRKKQ